MNAEGAAVSISVEVRPAATPSDAPLPHTGWEAGTLAVIALALVLFGALAVLATRTLLERTHA